MWSYAMWTTIGFSVDKTLLAILYYSTLQC